MLACENQGTGYPLLGCLLKRNDMAAAKELLAAYEDEWSATWLYTRALVAFPEVPASGQQAPRLVQDARSANQHVPVILACAEPAVTSRNGYITMGGADEATDYVRDCGRAWRETPVAVAWLNKLVSALPRKPRGSSTAH